MSNLICGEKKGYFKTEFVSRVTSGLCDEGRVREDSASVSFLPLAVSTTICSCNTVTSLRGQVT